MSKTDNVKGYNDNKKINCLITLFATLFQNSYKIRLCEIWNIAFFI